MELVHSLAARVARTYSGSSNKERKHERAWFLRRRLYCCEMGGEMQLFLALGMCDGFRLLKIEDKKLIPIASHDENGPVDIVEPLHIPVHSSEREKKLGTANLRLLVTSGNNRSSFPNTCLKVYSIQEKKYVYVLRLRSPILDVQANSRSSAFAVHLEGEVQIYGAKDFRFLFTISCFSGEARGPTFSLGSCWLAFAGGLEVHSQTSSGSSELPLAASIPSYHKFSKDYKGTLSTLTKDIMSGLYSLGNMGGQKIAEYISNGPEIERKSKHGHEHAAGYITIFDIHTRSILRVFKAHSTEIAHVAFDSSGSLLVTSGTDGQYLHVWQLLNTDTDENFLFTPCVPRLMYKIFRGITHAQIRNVSFSPDSRMLAISSQHGTAHIYSLDQLELHQTDRFPSTKKLQMHEQKNKNASNASSSATSAATEAENIVTFTPFHRIRQPSASSSDSDSVPLISAFFKYPRSPLSLVVVTSTHNVVIHSLTRPPPAEAEGSSSTSTSRSQSSLSSSDQQGSDNWELTVSENWQLESFLREHSIESSTKAEAVGDAALNGKHHQHHHPNNNNSKGHSSWLSQVEMNTYKSNEVPFWASPQFEMQAVKPPKARKAKSKELQNPDYLFWEDLEFEELQYRKHVSFSGLKVHEGLKSNSSLGSKVTEKKINGKILAAMESPILALDAAEMSHVVPEGMSKIVI
mmetsp:Transcript_13994/g.25256  ORF Transcript_13994/g.25256 Transcript_13994/m.25256 type:complete len:690 (-) Transcript_13994:696-2765(-)